MKKLFKIFVLTLISISSIKAQNIFSPQLSNVAFVGIKESDQFSINLNSIAQSNPIRFNSSTLNVLHLNQQILTKNDKLAFGLDFTNNLGRYLPQVFKKYKLSNIAISSSCKLVTKENINLRVGAKFGYVNNIVEFVLPVTNYNFSEAYFFQQIGISQHTHNYYIAFERFFSNSIQLNNYNRFNAAYNFQINSNFRLQPEVFFNFGKNLARTNLKFNLILKNRFWFSFFNYKYVRDIRHDSLNGFKINHLEFLFKSKDEKIKAGFEILLPSNYNILLNTNFKFAYSLTKVKNLKAVNNIFF